MSNARIHDEQSVAHTGELLANAEAAMIVVHGRGGTNHQALALADHLDVPGFAFLAPQATGHTWYPQRFIAPRAANEPHLSSALNVVDGLVNQIVEAGISHDKIMLLGFSQGACLAVEYAARNPKRYGGVMVLSGGLIGEHQELTGYDGDLAGTPVFLGCSDVDFHIPLERVRQSTAILDDLGGDVEERIYPGMGHTINSDEIEFVKTVMKAVTNG